jgi:hypothetical protein
VASHEWIQLSEVGLDKSPIRLSIGELGLGGTLRNIKIFNCNLFGENHELKRWNTQTLNK